MTVQVSHQENKLNAFSHWEGGVHLEELLLDEEVRDERKPRVANNAEAQRVHLRLAPLRGGALTHRRAFNTIGTACVTGGRQRRLERLREPRVRLEWLRHAADGHRIDAVIPRTAHQAEEDRSVFDRVAFMATDRGEACSDRIIPGKSQNLCNR